MPRPWIALESACLPGHACLLLALLAANCPVQAAAPAVSSVPAPGSGAASANKPASPVIPADHLRQDIDQWLRRELEAATSPVTPGPDEGARAHTAPPALLDAAPGGDLIRLHSLYGVGQRLIAEFSVAGLRMRAQQGLGRVRSQYTDLDQPVYVLHAVQWPCVQLQRPDGVLVETCLLPSGSEHD